MAKGGPLKLRKRTKRYFLLFFWAVVGTGTLDWIFDKWVRVQGAFGPEHHPLQPWISRAHTASAYLILISFGYLLHSHVRPGLKGKRKKVSGIAIVTFLSILAASSLPILYAADGMIRDTSTAVHTYMGLSIPLLLGIHLWWRKNDTA